MLPADSGWLWGLAVSLSMVLAAFLSPPLGAIADFARRRKKFLLLFTLVSVICTALMFFVQEGDILLGILLFIFANIGFEAGLVFYDAFLPNITSEKNFGRVSGYGYAMGYVGALTVLLIIMVLLPDSSSPDYNFYIRLSFVIASAFFLVFQFLFFLFIKEPEKDNIIRTELLKNGIQRSFNTFKSIFFRKEFPSVKKFLISFFLYNDAIITIIAFASIFASNILKMSDSEIIIFFAIVQSLL
jgi:MFS transporter, UMF1 family